ncbi:MAG: asparagine synthase (glutamine-hydrolyzing) [Algicola sp.]|nr:asparagine synthase (glutamine-hydrolyzing) [Algicola sp.]
MCGLLGEFCFASHAITSHAHFKNLLALSKHRGPDATEIVSEPQYQLGFNRLAILDISEKGNQPKRSPSSRYHMVFNGEIYNYKDLEATYNLQALRSTSDSEVLVSLLDILGVKETVAQLNGMFAIAIYDTVDNRVYLARDFAGIKPLFYGLSEFGCVVASQFDQVYKHEWLASQLALWPEAVKDYFGFGYMQAPNTIYKNIYQVTPGELITITTDGTKTHELIKAYPPNQVQASSESKATVDEVLKSVIKRQLVSDVSVATFLSGGIDSPLISAFAKGEKDDIEAFTLKVDHPNLNESEVAKSYADHLGIEQHIISVKASDLLKEVEAHFHAYSEPFGDYSSIPTYVITKEAKKYHTVMLSGDGGDELFFGYPRMLDVLDKRLWFKMPLLIRKSLAKITNTLGITKTWAPYFKSLDAFIMNKQRHVPAVVLDKAFKHTEHSDAIKKLYRFKNHSKQQLLYELRYNEFYAHLQRVLVKVDRASMKHSLEVRVPFLDKASIDYAWQLPGVLEKPSDLKKELKQALSRKVPKSIINQKKMGFSVPLFEWLHHQLKDDVIYHTLERPFYGNDIFDESFFKNFVKDFYAKKHEDVWGVWHLYAWQKWRSIHVNHL